MALLNEINVKGVPHPIVTDDGYYQEMTVGDAEQLVATTFTEDDAPYNFRTAGGAIDIGDRKQVEGIVGGTIAWNQLVENGNFADNSKWSSSFNAVVSISNGVATVTPVQQYSALLESRGSSYYFKANHIVLMFADVKSDGNRTSINMGFGDNINFTASKALNTTNALQTFSFMYKLGSTVAGTTNIFVRDNATSGYVTFYVKNVMFFDLTQMFGSTIADYIYSLEQANAGAGVAWFKKHFPKPYYAYNAGELMSVKALRHITRGFNAWDEEWEVGGIIWATGLPYAADDRIRSKNFNKCLPNTNYYLSETVSPEISNVCFYDAEYNPIFRYGSCGYGNGLVTSPSNAHYFKIVITSTSTYDQKVCFNLSWDGERDGEYEEYSEHVYEFDPDLELKGIPMLSAGNDLYYDGDTYEADGTVTRKYGVVDLGTLTWSTYTQSEDFHLQYAVIEDMNPQNGIPAICLKYPMLIGEDYYWSHLSDKQGVLYMAGDQRRIGIRDETYTDAVTFKTAMSGVYLVYELATPTEESADPYNGTQIVDDFGTEEFVDAGVEAGTRDVAIPVGHNSLYQPNLRAKLEMVPESPENEGYYVVYHHDGINEYVPLIIPQELPELPTEDGIYTLKCTVASGSATLSFESEV